MKLNKLAAATGVFLSLAVAAPTVALAKHGADDPVGHVRGGHGADDRIAQVRGGNGADDKVAEVRGGQRADDRAGDDRGGHGGHGVDDGSGHH